VRCSVLQCIAVRCSVLQYVAVCSVVYLNRMDEIIDRHDTSDNIKRVCVAMHCRALQSIAVCCSVLQCVAVRCGV